MSRTRYEYWETKVGSFQHIDVDKLTQYGQEGWKLTSSVTKHNGDIQGIFMREQEELHYNWDVNEKRLIPTGSNECGYQINITNINASKEIKT